MWRETKVSTPFAMEHDADDLFYQVEERSLEPDPN